MPGIFDAKVFNAEVFQKYVERIPNLNRNELIRSRAIRQRPDLASAMADQVGGNYITTPLKGLINGAAAQNYDGGTNLQANGTKTFSHSRVVVGRANAWTEKDFSYDITGGEDFMENIAQQISEYWEEIDQATIVHILNGVFNMSDAAGLEFIAKHSSDITNITNRENVVGKMDGTTLNTAMQKACGDNKSKFSLAIMHSMVATNLENLRLLSYLKYTDANGMQRDLAIGTLNGRTVLVDDNMPVGAIETTAGVYELTIAGTWAADDVITVAGVSHTVVSGSTSASAIASALETAFGSNTKYTASASSGKLTLTEKSGNYGAGTPAVTKTTTAGTTTIVEKTAAVVSATYTTYVLGDGAIEYTNCGAKVPYETDRDPAKNGGEDTLYSRQRKSFAPYGISFTKASMASLSPTDAELENGANWELVNDNDSTSKEYIAHKAIPIARIISLG